MEHVINTIKSPIGIIALSIFAVMTIASLLLKRAAKRKENIKLAEENDAFFCSMYEEYKKIPILKSYIRIMTFKISRMSVYTVVELKALIAKYLTFTITSMFVTMAATIIIFGDIPSVILCTILTYNIVTQLLEKKMGRVNYNVYTQLKFAIDAVRLEYMRCNDVVESLETANYGPRVAKIMDRIHTILVSKEGELRLKEFYAATPFKEIQTLAYVCYSINNTGDRFDKDGNSTFIEALLIMNKDINQELERQDYQHLKFGFLEYLALIPLPMIPIVTYFLKANMPASSIIYEGILGYVIRIVIIAACIYYYHYVASCNGIHVIKDDDSIYFIRSLLKNEHVYKFIRSISPKNKERRVLKQKLQNAFSKKTVDEFFTEKLIYPIGLFTFCMIFFISATITGRNYMFNHTGSLSLLANSDSEYVDNLGHKIKHKAIMKLDKTYINMRDKGRFNFKKLSQEDAEKEKEVLEKLISTTFPKLTDIQMSDQKTRLKTKYEWLKKVHFYWYYIVISFVVAILGYFIPNKSLRTRTNYLKEEEIEEFLQLQTVMTILMSMNCDTMDALDHLTQISTIHKDMLTCCYLGYSSNPIKELNTMIMKTPIPDFKRFVEKLKMTVDELSLDDAFIDLVQNREHLCNQRNELLRHNIDVRRNRCSRKVKIPFMMTLILLFVFPLFYLGYTQMMEGINELKEM